MEKLAEPEDKTADINVEVSLLAEYEAAPERMGVESTIALLIKAETKNQRLRLMHMQDWYADLFQER